LGIIYQMNAYPVTSRLAAASPVDALRFQSEIQHRCRAPDTWSQSSVLLLTPYGDAQ
jgi:hypothetical protein